MPKLSRRVTATTAAALPVPESGYAIHWCPGTPGLGLPITSNGAAAYISERRVNGKTVRRTLGAAVRPDSTLRNTITADKARELHTVVGGELVTGHDRVEAKRAKAREQKAESLTLGAALRQYIERKERAGGQKLKPRTAADYAAMLTEPRKLKDGSKSKPGLLYGLSNIPLHKLTGDRIRAFDKSELQKRGWRQRAYAHQVLRAVLRFHGAEVEASPYDDGTPEARRVRIAQSRGEAKPIPTKHLGMFWNAIHAASPHGIPRGIESADAKNAEKRAAAIDAIELMLLTGLRRGEVFVLKNGDYDPEGRTFTARDTKNGRDHVVYLSDLDPKVPSAQHVLVLRAKSSKPDALIFEGLKPGLLDKVLHEIAAAAGIGHVTVHQLRHTVASIVANHVSSALASRMLNHTPTSVTERFYIGQDAETLRNGWATVARVIYAAGESEKVKALA